MVVSHTHGLNIRANVKETHDASWPIVPVDVQILELTQSKLSETSMISPAKKKTSMIWV
jgi:hypothetical protein